MKIRVKCYLFLGFCFHISFLQPSVKGNVGTCTTFNQTAGECLDIQNCPFLYSLSKEPFSDLSSFILILSECGTEGESKVCCPDDDSIEFDDVDPPMGRPRFLGPLGAKLDSCSTAEGQLGKCIPTKECPALLNLLKIGPFTPEKRDYFKQAGCGFEGNDPMVCCPIGPIEPLVLTLPTEPIVSDLLPNLENCGPMFIDKIVGGPAADIAEFPWMALLAYRTKSGTQFNCGGSLISKRYVLTAAHCIKESLISVRLGEYDVTRTKDCTYCTDAIDIDIEQKIVHESYVEHNNDIALLRLAKEVTFSDFIKPICLPTTPDFFRRNFDGINMTVAGWGVTENGTSSNFLLKLTVPIKPLVDCTTVYGPKIKIRPAVICAGGEAGKDSCQGDSGGPLMVPHNVNVYAAGVVSFGSGECGLQNWPAVYTKVTYFIQWIVNKLKP